MTPTQGLAEYSRLVRIAVATSAVAVLPALLGLQLMVGQADQATRGLASTGVCDGVACPLSKAAERTVEALEGHGLSCRTRPALTDDIVFEWNDGRVEVLAFARTIEATSQLAGSVRRYCLPPE